MKTIKYNQNNITPSKVICIGRNYAEHIKELGNETPQNMVVFNKPNSAISDALYFISEDTRFEAEICLLMKDNKIDAVGIGLDLTKANIQNYLKSKSLPWEKAKAFNNSAVLSEFVSLEDDIQNLNFKLYINDTLTQEASYELMIYKPKEMIKQICEFMDIEDGDVIMTGTPKGVGTYKKNDKFLALIYSKNKLILKKEWIVL